MEMKKIPFFKLILPLIFIFLAPSCTLGHLKPELTVDDEVTQLIRNVPGAESYPEAGIINILDEDIVEVFEDGRCKETVHEVFKILQDRGKDNGDIKIGYNSRTETASIIYARTITPEGKIIPLNKNAVKVVTPFTDYPSYSDYKELTFSMPGVTVGSIIDYKTVQEKQKPEIEGKFSDEFYFQGYDPTYLCRYKVITHKDTDLKYLVLNPLQGIQSSPKIIHDGNKKIYLWEYKNIPQIIEQTSMPPTDEVAFRILVTTMNSWEEFCNWWKKKIAGKTEPDEAIKRKVAELTKGLSTSREKMEAIFDYVKEEIRYVFIDLGKSGYEPENAQKVFENKYGDCKDKSTLLISMLRAAGIPAYYVLIPTSSVGNLIKDFPYPFQFNHCIAVTKKEGTYNFFDPAAENYRIDYLPSTDQERDVLIFDNKKIVFARTPLAKPEENAYYTYSQIKIGLDGSIQGEVKNYSFGGEEASLRSFFKKSSPTKIKDSLEERVDKISSGAKLLKYTHTNPLNFKERFEVTIKYNAKDYCRKAGDILIFDVPEIQKRCPAIGKKDLKYPIEIWNTSYKKDEVEFNIPEGYEVYHLPEPMEIKNQYFEFRSSYRQEGKRIFYQGELITKVIRIASEECASYQQWCFRMEKSFNRSVLFRKKGNG
jgi:transglutaminase-like putative cysteine protease